MALSGTLYSSYKNGRRLRITWSVTSQDQIANTSTIHLEFGVYSGSPTAYTSEAYRYRFNGETNTINWTGTLTAGSWKTLRTANFTVTHADDGTGSFPVYFAFPYYKSSDTMILEDNIVVDTIPRASTVSCPNGESGTSVDISIVKANSSFTSTLYYQVAGGTKTQIVDKTSATTYAWTIPNILSLCSSTEKSKNVTIICETYDGNVKLGESQYIMVATLSSAIASPTMTVAWAQTDYRTQTGSATKLVLNLSDVTVTPSVTLKGGATINTLVCNNVALTNNTAKTFNAVTTNVFTVTVTDSRGFTATVTKTYEYVNYFKPTITITVRVTPDSQLLVNATGAYKSGTLGAVSNTVSVSLQYREVGTSAWTTSTMSTSTGTGDYTSTGIVTAQYDKSWETRAYVTDAFSTVYTSVQSVTGVPVFYWNKSEFNFTIPVSAPLFDKTLMLAGNNGEVLSGGDFNDFKICGVYKCHVTDCANQPEATSGTLIVRTGEGDIEKSLDATYIYLQQLFIPRAASAIYMRSMIVWGTTGVWSYGAWTKLSSATTPADYIVEVGTSSVTNCDWEYTKWNSGKIECHGRMSAKASWSSLGNVYYMHGQVNLPTTLKTMQMVTLGAMGCSNANASTFWVGEYARNWYASATNFTAVDVAFFRASTGQSADTYYAGIHVVGTYK